RAVRVHDDHGPLARFEVPLQPLDVGAVGLGRPERLVAGRVVGRAATGVPVGHAEGIEPEVGDLGVGDIVEVALHLVLGADADEHGLVGGRVGGQAHGRQVAEVDVPVAGVGPGAEV